MSEEHNLVHLLAGELRLLAEPLRVASDAAGLERLLADFGWQLDGLANADVSATVTATEELVAAIDAVTSAPLDGLGDFVSAAADLGSALGHIDDVQRTLTDAGAPNLPQELSAALSEDLSQHLLLHYMRRRSLAAYELGLALTLVAREQAEPLRSDGRLVRMPVRRPALRLDNAPRLLNDPIGHLAAAYVPAGGVTTEAAAQQFASSVFAPVRNLLVTMGAVASLGLENAAPGERENPANAELLRMLTAGFGGHTVIVVEDEVAEARGLFGATATVVPADTEAAPGVPGPGLEIAPFGTVDLERVVAGWRLAVSAGAVPARMFIGTQRSAALDGAAPEFTIRAELTPADDDAPVLVVGGGGTRLEIGSVAIAAELALRGETASFGFEVVATDAVLAVARADGDGFLQMVLPPNGIRAPFALGLGWANDRGVFVTGGAGLEATIPVDFSVLGIIELSFLTVGLQVAPDTGSVTLEVGASGGLHLGPVRAAIDNVGLRAELGFPRAGGNLGIADLRDLAFKPPTGVALSIDAPPVVGGGFLSIDHDRGEYAGVMQLALAGLSVSAIGIITTRPGEFSLLVIISVEFTPVQLGFGFTLNGVGGLLAVNRGVALEQIEAGLREGALDAILFPRDPVRNAPQLIATLARFFPPDHGQYVVGPSVVIGWGTPTLVTLTLGVYIEFPSPLRLILAGRLHMLLPTAAVPVAVVQMDLLGSIDFTNGRLAADASLRDSRLAQYALAGDVAIRASWGREPGFMLAAGGFHPGFKPPAGIPRLNRLSIALAIGDNPRLQLAAYLAVTSNTLQFGARLDLYAAADLVVGNFSLAANVGFDAIINFDPFGFVVDIYAGIVLKRDDKPFLSVDLTCTLSGPEQWRAHGEVTFSFLGRRSIRFELVVGDEPEPAPPELADVLGLLRVALEDPRNWEAQRPADGRTLVSVRAGVPADEVIVHPLGSVVIRQNVVPLETDITRFGPARPRDARRFALFARAADGSTRRPDALLDGQFARAQFLDLTDMERLAAPSFEPMPAAARFGTGGMHFEAGAVRNSGSLVYDEYLVDVVDREPDSPPSPLGAHELPEADVLRLVGGSAVAVNGTGATGAQRFIGDVLAIALRPLEYRLATLDGMRAPAGLPADAVGFGRAIELLRSSVAEDPGLAGALVIVGAHEVANAGGPP